MNYVMSKHARKALEEREILTEWMERALSAQDLILPDSEDAAIERYFRRIPEFGDRLVILQTATMGEPGASDQTVEGERFEDVGHGRGIVAGAQVKLPARRQEFEIQCFFPSPVG